MIKRALVLAVSLISCCGAFAQTDTVKQKQLMLDTTTVDYDDLFDELDLFLDSINTPRSFFLVNLGTQDAHRVQLTQIASSPHALLAHRSSCTIPLRAPAAIGARRCAHLETLQMN